MKFPFIGFESLFFLLRNASRGRLLEAQSVLYSEHGYTFDFRVLRTDSIQTSDPEKIETLLSTKFKDFSLGNVRTNAMRPLLGHGIFASNGARWKASRDMLHPCFTRDQIADLGALERNFLFMRAHLPGDGTAVDIVTILLAFTLDSATEFLFGQSVDALGALGQEDNAQAASKFALAFSYAQDNVMYRFRLREFSRFSRDPKAIRAIRFIHDYVQRSVDDALALRKAGIKKQGPDANGGNYNFLQELAQPTDDPVVLRDELLSVLIAGRDSIALLMSNLFFVLTRRPDVWIKLQADVGELHESPPTYETLRNLKYLKH